MPRRFVQLLSLLLGIEMALFGFLKFFQPFAGWFDIQIQQSHLPHGALLGGKLGEMLTGCLFLLPWLYRSLREKYRNRVLLAACALLFAQMAVAIYVHLQPGVPASVLPLGIKAPIIPATTLLLGILTALAVLKRMQSPSENAS